MVEILKLALIIAVIIVMIRLKVPLSIALMASALILGLLFRLPLTNLGAGVLDTLLNLENLKMNCACPPNAAPS
jgi:hypothetical protein